MVDTSLAKKKKGVGIDRSIHLTLIAEAKKDGVDTELLEEILWLLIAPDNLIGFLRAAKTILRILELAPDSWQQDLSNSGIIHWKPILEWVIQNDSRLTHTLGSEFGKQLNTSNRNPLNGSYITDYPYFSVFCEVPPQKHTDQFYLLVGQFLIANVYALKEQSSQEAYEKSTVRPWKALVNGIESVSVSIRRYSETPTKEDSKNKSSELVERRKEQNRVLALLPVDSSPETFPQKLENLNPSKNSVIIGDNEKIIRFFKKVYSEIQWVKRKGGSGGGGSGGGDELVGGIEETDSPISHHLISFDEGEDPSSNWGDVEVFSPKTLSSKERKAQLESDLPPDEDDGDDFATSIPVDCNESKKGLGTLARQAKAKQRKLERQNQNMPWDYKGLAVDEIATLRKYILDNLNQLMKEFILSSDDQLRVEGLFILHVMLWTGAHAKDAVKIIRHTKGSQATKEPVSIFWDPDIKKFCWEIRAISPEYQLKVTPIKNQVRQLATYFYLPTLKALSLTLKKIFETRRKKSNDERVCLNSDQNVLDQIDKELICISPDRRITKDKISNAIWEQLVLRTGDSTMASCITGRDHHLSKVRIFYTAPSIKKLQETYLSVIQESDDLVQKAAGLKPKKQSVWMPDEKLEGESVGARMCPTLSAVKQLFDQLKKDIKLAKQYEDEKGFIRFHNLYTLYTLQFFAYSTTYRAIKTPYLHLKQINRDRGIAAVTDKDDGSNHKSRLVWLPDKLMQQMVAYEEHLNNLKMSKTHLQQGRFKEFPCFFLNDNGNPLEARPLTIEPLLEKYIKIRANTHRRFLRTELLERGCMPEAIDACMGHWIVGEEPHGIYSSFNFGDYVEHLKPYITKIHEDIGLNTIIHSPLVKGRS